MKKELQRIKIAEACGWTTKHKGLWVEQLQTYAALPDYLNDLNAMHEAEKVLTEKQQRDYCFRLLLELVDGSVTNDLNDHFIFIRATAAQRAEAFLKTLNLWEE